MAAQFNLDIDHMVAVTAFLQDDLMEKKFMEPDDTAGEADGKVCKLNKAISGLKQACLSGVECNFPYLMGFSSIPNLCINLICCYCKMFKCPFTCYCIFMCNECLKTHTF